MPVFPIVPSFYPLISRSRASLLGNGNPPHQPLLTAEADDLAYRKMEEGAYVPVPTQYQPVIPRASEATRNFCKVFLRSFAAVSGIILFAYIFVWRFVFHDPELQNNFIMTLYSVLSLFFIGSVYCMTRDDDYDPDVYYI